ncbi:MAG: MFS transporter [Bacteroidetes bacterium]|jgi:predicted MFS family arabinose efflux permease|nr:MAG: MFS transporter [Bacteroidota bacterium]
METQTTTIENKFTGYQRLVILLIALTQFTVVLDFMVMSPLGDMLMKSMELTTKQFGLAVSVYAFSAGTSGLLTAGFADRFDRKKLLLFFYIGFIAGTLFCGLANSYVLLIAARIITGLFGGVIGSISLAIVADLFPLQKRGRAMGFIQMGFGASQVLGIPISLFIANHWGWQSPFRMIVGLATIIWILVMLKLQPVTKHLELKTEKTAIKHLWHTLRLRDYRTGFLLTALLSIGGFMMMPWGSAFAVNNLQVSYEQLPLMFMASGIAALIVMPLIGKLSDKIDKVKLFTVAALSMMVIIVVYTNLTPVPFLVIISLNILMMTAIMSRIVPAMALVSALPKMQDRGAFMSINSSLQQIAGGIAAAVGGIIVIQKTKTSPLQHYDTLGYVIVVIIILNIIQLYRVSNMIKAKKHADKL